MLFILMLRFLVITTLTIFLTFPLSFRAQTTSATSATAAKSKRYIIRLKSTANLRHFDPQFKHSLAQYASAAPDDNQLIYQYTKVFPGYAGKFSQEFIQDLQHDPHVQDILEDVVGKLDDATPRVNPPLASFHWNQLQKQQPLPNNLLALDDVLSWGLRRISTRQYNPNAAFITPQSKAENIIVYVLDSGIETQHPAFEERASFLGNFVANEPDEDVLGHGTHVAGIIAATWVGVAQKARVVGVRVCDLNADCAASDIVAGISAILKRHATAPYNTTRAIINMSLGIPGTSILDDAIQVAVQDYHIPVFASAGNDHTDGCDKSPRRSPLVFTVSATDESDSHWPYGNYGRCVRVYAPGNNIVSVVPGVNDDGVLGRMDIKSGTSFAAPHVTGIAALFLAQHPRMTVNELYDAIEKRATKDAVKQGKPGTTTTLAYALYSDADNPSSASRVS